MNISNKVINDFIKGKQEATAKVYHTYKNLVYFVIANYIDNKDDCDDVISETFIKVIEHHEEIGNPNNLKAFLCSTAKNEAINFLKKNRPIPGSDIIDEMYGEEDKSNSLLNALEPLLTNKEAIVVYYKAVFGYSWDEIVNLTGIPNSTARRIYDSAKEKMRKELL